MLNGISVAFLMENMLILYAIANGMSDGLVAVLASFIHLTMPFMVLGKRLIERQGLAKAWGLCWLLRYVSIVVIVFAPFLDESPVAASLLILAGTLGFNLFRAMGLTAGTPLVGEITTDRDRGRYISGNVVRERIAYSVAMVAAVLLLRTTDSVWPYQVIIVLGCALGIASSRILASVPESSSGSESARKPIRESFRELFARSSRRRLVVGWCAGFSAFALVIPFSVIAVKNGYQLSDEVALIFSVLTIVGGILASAANGVLSDRVGPRPLLILYAAGLWVCSLFWALAPGELYPILVGIVFLLAGFCKIGILINLGHYLLSLVDGSERVGANLFVRMISGAAAGLAGSVLGASLLEGLKRFSVTGMAVYRTYFAVITIVLIPLVFALYRMKRLSEWRVRRVLKLLVSPRHLRSMLIQHAQGGE